MRKFENYIIAVLGIVLGISAGFASNVLVNQKAWYNAAVSPFDPPFPVFATITDPNNTSTPALQCSRTVQVKICTINGRQAYHDPFLKMPLFRGF